MCIQKFREGQIEFIWKGCRAFVQFHSKAKYPYFFVSILSAQMSVSLLLSGLQIDILAINGAF